MAENSFHSTSPDAYILFFPYLQEQTKSAEPYSDKYLETQVVEVKSELISVTTSKSKGGAGSWSCVVGSNINYKALIHPGCWCLIYISDEQIDRVETGTSGSKSGLKMMGVVRSVRTIESLSGSTGTKTVRYEFAGIDFHSVLENQVYVNRVILGQNDGLKDALAIFKELQLKPLKPDEAVRAIINAVLGNSESIENTLNKAVVTAGGAYAIPPQVATAAFGSPSKGNKFINSMNLLLYPKLIGQVAFQPDLGGMFSCWSLVQSYSHPLLNETYTELIPDKSGKLRPTVVMRPIPFSSPKSSGRMNSLSSIYEGKDVRIDNLPTLSMMDGTGKRSTNDVTPEKGSAFYTSKNIHEHEILSLNYGKSDAERFNFFYVVSAKAIAEGLDGVKLWELTRSSSIAKLGDPNSIARHGLRPYITQSEYLTLDVDIAQVNIVARDLWSRAYLFENGIVSIAGSKEHIPVGTNIKFADRGWVAHVEQVNHSYSVNPGGDKSFMTTIAFVRLQTTSGEPIDVVNRKQPNHEWDRGVTHSLSNSATNKVKK